MFPDVGSSHWAIEREMNVLAMVPGIGVGHAHDRVGQLDDLHCPLPGIGRPVLPLPVGRLLIMANTPSRRSVAGRGWPGRESGMDGGCPWDRLRPFAFPGRLRYHRPSAGRARVQAHACRRKRPVRHNSLRGKR